MSNASLVVLALVPLVSVEWCGVVWSAILLVSVLVACCVDAACGCREEGLMKKIGPCFRASRDELNPTTSADPRGPLQSCRCLPFVL